MRDRFHGIGRLYGMNALNPLSNARMMVVGIGGVGSWAAESLARTGVGHIMLVDLDDICVSNINRQVHSLNSTVGQLKVDATEKRLREINPDVTIVKEASFLSLKNIETLLAWNPDVVIDCMDDVDNKVLLATLSRERGFKLVTVGASGGRSDPTQIVVSDLKTTCNDKLIFKVRKILRQDHGFPREHKGDFGIRCISTTERGVYATANGQISREPQDIREGLDCATGYGSVSFVTGTFGFFAASEAVRLVLEKVHLPKI